MDPGLEHLPNTGERQKGRDPEPLHKILHLKWRIKQVKEWITWITGLDPKLGSCLKAS